MLPTQPVGKIITVNEMQTESEMREDFHLRITATVAESGSLSKTIKVDSMLGASSTRYNLLFLKK